MVDFLIVSSGYNCAKYVRKCYDSIVNQTYGNFKAILIDDGSPGEDMLESFTDLNNSDDRIRLFNCPKNNGAAYRRYWAIKKFAESETVIVLLGLDDELRSDALEKIKEQYDKGKWMTYGNWIAQDGSMLPKGFLHFGTGTHEKRDYRKETYRSTAVNTFKRFLFDRIHQDEFKFNSQWIKATTESHLMFSCLEMCGEKRIGIIEEPIYLYNKGRLDNARKRLGDNYQDSIFNDVISRPKKDLL